MIEVDARGLSCPIPVVRTLQAINKNPGSEIVVLVNDPVAEENISRLAKNRGYSFSSEEMEDGLHLTLKPA